MYLPICSMTWFILSTFVLNADGLSTNGRRLFSSLFYLSLELSAMFAILLLDGIAPNLNDLLKIAAIMVATGNISYFLKFDYKNDVGLYFRTTFWEILCTLLASSHQWYGNFYFCALTFPSSSLIFFCLYWKMIA